MRHDLGHLCGYVAVPPGHPCYGHGYTTVYEKGEDGEDDYDKPLHNPADALTVQGGITYAEKCSGHVCHVPAEPDDVWWLGFDMAHAGDRSPGMEKFMTTRSGRGAYRTVEYVRQECEDLARQLVVAARTGKAES